MVDSKMKLKTLPAFFRAILDELKKKLSPAEFADFLENYKTEQREGAKAAGTASTPGQVPSSSDEGDCHATD